MRDGYTHPIQLHRQSHSRLHFLLTLCALTTAQLVHRQILSVADEYLLCGVMLSDRWRVMVNVQVPLPLLACIEARQTPNFDLPLD